MSPPRKIPHSRAGPGSPSNTWFPELTRVCPPNGISIGSGTFAQRSPACPTKTHAHKRTDHATSDIRSRRRKCAKAISLRRFYTNQVLIWSHAFYLLTYFYFRLLLVAWQTEYEAVLCCRKFNVPQSKIIFIGISISSMTLVWLTVK